MDVEIASYIKNMFSYPLPEWDESYEGVILYDTTNKNWVCGDNIGWIVLKEEN